MSWDEEQASRVVRRVLTDAPVPPTKVDVGAVLQAGRRSERRRRRLTVALAAVAVLAIGAGSAAVLGRGDHDRSMPVTGRSPELLPAPTVVPVTVTLSKDPVQCTAEQFPAPKEAYFPRVEVADPTGRFLAGTSAVLNWRTEKMRTYLVLWDRGKPTLYNLSRAYEARVTAVNSAGIAVGTRWDGNARPDAAWVLRDGQVRNLTLPPGYRHVTPLAVNERGDILGQTEDVPGRGSGVPVVWPAGSDGPPRVVGKPGFVQVVGWTADGTIVGFETGSLLRLWRADGSSAMSSTPAGWQLNSWTSVRGDWVAGFVPGPNIRKPLPAAWNLRTGQVFVYHGLDTIYYFELLVDPSGRLLVGSPHDGWSLVEQDGTARTLAPPAEAKQHPRRPVLIDDTGSIQGAVEKPAGQHTPGMWRCR